MAQDAFVPDATDRRILAVLQGAGRISNAELSERVHLSASACHRRVQRLEAEGIIARYVALLDPRRIGRTTTVFVEIKLAGQSDEVLNAFEAAVRRVPDVLECQLMISRASIASTCRACPAWCRCNRPLPCARCCRRRRSRFDGGPCAWRRAGPRPRRPPTHPSHRGCAPMLAVRARPFAPVEGQSIRQCGQ
jgi:DNA-binding Lrp family transcriptional regulator